MIEHLHYIKIGTINYRVSVDRAEWVAIQHKHKRVMDFGLTDHESATIYLNPDTPHDVKRLTLMHEIMHATSTSMMGNPEFRNLGKNQTDREENVIRMWESPLLQVLRDNPDLVAYLTL